MTLQNFLGLIVQRFGQDAWSAEVVSIHTNGDQRVSDPIVGLGMVPRGDTFEIAIMCQSEIERLIERDGKPPVIGQISKS